MALKLVLYEALCELTDDETDMILVAGMNNQMIACIGTAFKRTQVPRVPGYVQTVVSLMGLPENVDDFSVHYRLSRHTFDCILELISHKLNKKGRGKHEPVPPEKKMLSFLSYIVNQQSMREVAHIFNMSKSTLHQVIKDVCAVMLETGYQYKFIQWPHHAKQTEIATSVHQACGISGVVGFIDGTHIRLASALGGDKDYYNRKGFPSIQLQVVVDYQMTITDAYVGWPGCTHDARVLRNSSLYEKAEAGHLVQRNHHIIGDSAYPLRNWLITPFKNVGHLTPQQIRFNCKLSGVRQTVERAFGHLKGRFRRLKEIPLHDARDICNLIYCACILHNLCLLHEDDVQQYIDDVHDDPGQCENIFENGRNGVLRRLQLLNNV